jgi:hypothetical protein
MTELSVWKTARAARIKNMSENEVLGELLKMGWEKKDLGLINRRIVALARAGELAEDIAVRLNPKKVVERPDLGDAWLRHERAIQASPALDHQLSALVRDARIRQRIERE